MTALIIFAVSAAILLHKSLLPHFTLVPLEIIQDIKPWDHLDLGPRANRLIIDPFFIFYPNRFIQTAAIQSGHFPLWNPYIFTGTPVLADPNFQPFYLPNLLAAMVLPAHSALPWLAWAHLTLTGLFMYLFLTRKGLHWLAAVLGGGVWLLNGYLLVWLENPHRLSTAAWLPGIFWSFEVALQEKKPVWAAVSGLFLGLAVLGGQVQFVLYFGLILALYTLFQAYYRFKDGLSNRMRPFYYFILLTIIGLGIGSLVILPAAEFSSISQRSIADSVTLLDSRWPVTQLITLIAPDFYGNPASEVLYWGSINYAEVTVYFGIVSLLLAVSAVFVARDKRFLITTLVILGAVFLIALGTPLARLLSTVPGFQFLALRRSIIFIPFLGTWLAAAGLDGWLQAGMKWRRIVVALASSLILLAGIALLTSISLGQAFIDHQATALETLWRAFLLLAVTVLLILSLRRWPLIGGVLLVFLALGELLQWGYKFNPISSIDYLYPDSAVTEFLQQDETLFRVLPLQSGKAVFGPNILSVFSLADITGYSSLIKSEYADLLQGMDNEIDIGWLKGNENILVMSHFHPLVGLLNVKYILSAGELAPSPELELDGQFDGVWIYEYKNHAERAFLVKDVQETAPENLLKNLLSDTFDWHQTALISDPLPEDQARQLGANESPAEYSLEITNYTPQEVSIFVETPQPAFMVLADAYYPGWRAVIDGQMVPIYQTNLVQRGLFVPAGEHEIIFQFRPQTLKYGISLAFFSLIMVVGIVVYSLKRKDYGSIDSRIN